MSLGSRFSRSVWAGAAAGRGSVYDVNGDLVSRQGESFHEVVTGWDMDVSSPWRRWMPKTIFMGFNSKVASRLYITSERIVLIREIDPWRETSGDMSPLGIPKGVAKQYDLKTLKQVGIREFCEVRTKRLRLVSSKRFQKRGSMVDMRLIGDDGRRYALSLWKTDGKDDKTLDLIEAQFRTVGT